jgi:Holliday junction resolvase RusA-like endonuclease
MSTPTISFFVPGRAKPAGSKRAIPLFKGSGENRKWFRNIVTDDCERSADWKADVSLAARRAYSGPLLTCALEVEFKFIVARPMGDFGTKGNVKPKALPYPIKKPDLLKLARGIEDAMSGIIYRDDNLIVRETLAKDYQDKPDGVIGCQITIIPLENKAVTGTAQRMVFAEVGESNGDLQLLGDPPAVEMQ